MGQHRREINRPQHGGIGFRYTANGNNIEGWSRHLRRGDGAQAHSRKCNSGLTKKHPAKSAQDTDYCLFAGRAGSADRPPLLPNSLVATEPGGERNLTKYRIIGSAKESARANTGIARRRRTRIPETKPPEHQQPGYCQPKPWSLPQPVPKRVFLRASRIRGGAAGSAL
jgi:hypothetical protein